MKLEFYGIEEKVNEIIEQESTITVIVTFPGGEIRNSFCPYEVINSDSLFQVMSQDNYELLIDKKKVLSVEHIEDDEWDIISDNVEYQFLFFE